MIAIEKIVTPIKKITGIVIVYEPGDKLKVTGIDKKNHECTIEKLDGTGCIVGVPIKFLKLLK